MSNIKEIPGKIYVNALVVAGVPTAKVVRADIRSQEKQGDLEYTLLNSIWRKPSETPKKYPADIITYSDYGEGTSLDYAFETRRYKNENAFLEDWGECTNAVAWCYITDIIPEGGLLCVR